GTTFTFIHSGNLGDDWSAPFDFEELTGYGWDLYMHTLQQYLTYFQNHTAVFVTAEAPEHAKTKAAWRKLEDALRMPCSSGDLRVDDEIWLRPKGLPAIRGVVDYIQPG